MLTTLGDFGVIDTACAAASCAAFGNLKADEFYACSGVGGVACR